MKKIILIVLILIIIVSIFLFFSNKRRGAELTASIANPIITEENQNTNAANKNMIQMENGLKIEILKQGAGEEAKNNGKVTVHYTGILQDGTKFDSSLDRNQPFSFILGTGQVIRGWDLGVLGMKVGEKRKLTIPSELGYGSAGVGPIPPNAILIFEVELLGINE